MISIPSSLAVLEHNNARLPPALRSDVVDLHLPAGLLGLGRSAADRSGVRTGAARWRPDRRAGTETAVDARDPRPCRSCDRRVAAEAEARQRHRAGCGIGRVGRRSTAGRRRPLGLRPAVAGGARDARPYKRLPPLCAPPPEHALPPPPHPHPLPPPPP